MAETIYKFTSDLKGLQQLNAGLKEAQANLAALKKGTKEYAAASKNVKGLNSSLENNNKVLVKTRKAANQLNTTGRGLMTTFKGASIAIISAFAFRAIMAGMKGLVTIFAKFESQMAAVKAISGATDKEFDALIKSAKDLGETTVFTATEVGKLQEELSRLGFQAPQIIAMQKAILNLAAATGESLAKAAEVAGSQINAFGLEAEQAVRVTDVMGFAFANSALNLERFTQSMKFVAPVAKTAGFTIEETSALLMTLADNGIHGSIAGNALKNVFLRLGDANSKLNKSIGYTVQGLPQLIEEMKKMEKETFGLTEATDLLDKRSAPAFLTLLRNIEELEIKGDQINRVEGDISRMAAVRLDTLAGDFTLLKSATEGLGLAVGETFNHMLRKNVFNLTRWVRELAKNEKALKTVRKVVYAVYEGLKFLLIRMVALRAITALNTAHSMMFGMRLKRFLVPLRAATVGTTGLVRAKTALMHVMKRMPWAMIVTGIGMLIGSMKSAKSETDEMEFAVAKLTDSFNEELDAVVKLGEHSIERHDQLREMNATYGDLLGNIDLEIMKTKDLFALKDLVNGLSAENIAVMRQEAKIKKMMADEESRLLALPPGASSTTTSLAPDVSGHPAGGDHTLMYNKAGERVYDASEAYYGEDENAYVTGPGMYGDLDAISEAFETSLATEMEYLDSLKEVRQTAIEDSAIQNGIITESGESFRQALRYDLLGELEDFRTFGGSKQQEYIKQQEDKLDDLKRTQLIIDNADETKNASDKRQKAIEKTKSESEAFDWKDDAQMYVANRELTESEQAAITNKYSDLSQKSLDNSNKAVKKFHTEYKDKAGQINIMVSEMRKHVSNLSRSLVKSGDDYDESALSGFRLQRTKDSFKELRKIQISQINDTFERDMASAQASHDNKVDKFNDEKKLIDKNIRTLEGFQKKVSKDQLLADIEANKNNYDVLKEFDEKKWEEVMDTESNNLQYYLDIVQDMMDEEQEKEKTNAEIIKQIKSHKENEELKIKLKNQAKLNEIASDTRSLELQNMNTDISNLRANQKLRLEIQKERHDKERINDQALLDAKIITQEQFDLKAAKREKEVTDNQKKSLEERQAAFKEVYSAMADVVMSISANIAQANMERIEDEHEGRTEDLNNAFERDLEIATAAGQDTEAMQSEHNSKMESLEDQKNQKIREIKRKQFVLDKANSVAMAIINGAMAITKVTGQTGIAAIGLAPIMSGIIAAEIATILAQRFTGAKGGIIPGGDDKFALGGLVHGPSHAQGGVMFSHGGRVSELEGGEAVINKRSTAMFQPQLSAMNVAGGGKAFAQGGVTPGTRAALDGARGNWTAGDIAELISSSINSQQVYVSESDITSTQSTIGVTESFSNLF